LGTGNDFAGALGLPADPAAAAAVVLSGRHRQIDVGQARPDTGAPRPFVCAVGMGLDEPALRHSGSVRWLPPRLRYGYGGVRALQGLAIRVEADEPIRLCIDGDVTELTTPVALEARSGALTVIAGAERPGW